MSATTTAAGISPDTAGTIAGLIGRARGYRNLAAEMGHRDPGVQVQLYAEADKYVRGAAYLLDYETAPAARLLREKLLRGDLTGYAEILAPAIDTTGGASCTA